MITLQTEPKAGGYTAFPRYSVDSGTTQVELVEDLQPLVGSRIHYFKNKTYSRHGWKGTILKAYLDNKDEARLTVDWDCGPITTYHWSALIDTSSEYDNVYLFLLDLQTDISSDVVPKSKTDTVFNKSSVILVDLTTGEVDKVFNSLHEAKDYAREQITSSQLFKKFALFTVDSLLQTKQTEVTEEDMI